MGFKLVGVELDIRAYGFSKAGSGRFVGLGSCFDAKVIEMFNFGKRVVVWGGRSILV